ncbi:16S rRNA (cytosine(1402)-N(4))-methyltransferase RsmH [Candidatus Nomurabacteria bacterium]|nr:16S rRNA (cytosine(1402)-N(4))-methyltransferase RsmH [Candidatus Kaiserbacteria bacterium]MCB9810131.1 16S rRNA (cytosine(1402)-N(4))-methyltransferase RsmH [Candidatus Nomurabacteria bacterium]MCB9818529.1 16S rRNA (cytosine(1402)-N(4))-methyltransferase RsmH [Candidatus Nomurabacteria bacterium]
MQHKTVLLYEAVDGLQLSPSDTVVDATFGSGGHARLITQILDKDGCYIGIDADETALDEKKLGDISPQIHLVHDNFSQITNILRSLHIEKVDAILADLGWRMEQFADGEKGFSFMHDGPLHMTFGKPEDYTFTAEDIVNDWEEHVLADVFYGYAEERYARRIAKAIVEARKSKRITSTLQLVEIVEYALPKAAKKGKINPATKVFQALRIAVNDELTVLESFIKDAFMVLKPGGRLAIITFHSIEDRVVKHSFRELKDAELATLMTKKPIAPSEEELKENPRARSAKLRIITKNV